MSGVKIAYRADIEGLRAIAVLLVIAAHAGLPGFEAGFIGVDVFFVISGYLITGLLLAEYQRHGRIKLSEFYARRLRRLLPALLLMLTIAAIAAWVILPSSEHSYQARAGASASVWLSNLHFAFASVDYFGPAAETNIYLHTWSLGVEEQFYLLWPLLILLLLKMSKTGSDVMLGMLIMLVVSLAACLWLASMSPNLAFYLMPARGWQFAAGALAWLAYSDDGGGGRFLSERGELGLGLVALAILVASLILIGGGMPYPSYLAILPTLATAGLLIAGKSGKGPLYFLLSARPMQVIGNLSYAWYLWHWPVLILGASIAATGPAEKSTLVVVSFLLAVLSYLLVERPVRASVKIIEVPRFLILMSLLLMLAATLVLISWAKSAEKHARESEVSAPSAYSISLPVIYAKGCDDWFHSDRLMPCVFGPERAERTVVAIGDSIGLQWFPAYEKTFSDLGWRLVVLTKSSCPMVNRPVFNQRIRREFIECETWRERALRHVESLKPDVLIMGTTHAAGFSERDWIEGTNDVLARVAPVTGQVFIMRSTPTLPFNGAVCVRSMALEKAETECSAPSRSKLNYQVAAWLARAAARWPNVDLVDMNDVVCPEGMCYAMRFGGLAYRDDQHLNAKFVESLVESFRSRLGEFGPTAVVDEGLGVEK